MRKTCLALALSTAVVILGGVKAEAASITFSNQTFTASGGSGWGNVLSVLGLQQGAQAVTEGGSVGWNGSADVFDSTDVTTQSATRTVVELAAAGVTSADAEFGLVFNIDETAGGGSVQLAALQMNFFDAAGTVLFSAPYTCVACAYPFPLMLRESAQGLGNSGFLFRVALNDAERATFFASGANRIGLAANVWGTDGGAEQFYLTGGLTLYRQPAGCLNCSGVGNAGTAGLRPDAIRVADADAVVVSSSTQKTSEQSVVAPDVLRLLQRVVLSSALRQTLFPSRHPAAGV